MLAPQPEPQRSRDAHDAAPGVAPYASSHPHQQQQQQQQQQHDGYGVDWWFVSEPNGGCPTEEDEDMPECSASSTPQLTSEFLEQHREMLPVPQNMTAVTTAAMTAAKKKKESRKNCRPSYIVRKAEKTSLQLQSQLLQTQLEQLQRATTSPGDEASHPGSSVAENRKRALSRRQFENEALRQVVQDQELSFAVTQSAFGDHMSTHTQMPFESYIRLEKDWAVRHATLLSIKDKKIQLAQRYLAARTQFLDPSAPFAESSKFVSRSGDMCVRRCDIVPFEGVSSVKTVFDALLFYLMNMEISVSEVLGDITIREDEEDGARLQGISQNRLVSSVRDDVQVEINTVMFCKYFDASDTGGDGARDFGVLVVDFVDEDELYPYSPGSRLRNDVSAAIKVSMESRKTVNALGEETGDEQVVVLTRAASLNLRKTDLPIPVHVMQQLRTRIEGWCDAMMNTVSGIVYPQLHSSGPESDRVRRLVEEQ